VRAPFRPEDKIGLDNSAFYCYNQLTINAHRSSQQDSTYLQTKRKTSLQHLQKNITLKAQKHKTQVDVA